MVHRRFLVSSLAGAAIAATCASIVDHGGRKASAAPGPTSWYTRSYDVTRSGANLSETVLTQGNVVPGSFGLRRVDNVDDVVYAQPLYAYHVAGTKYGTVNALYVATANNTVYAFNADNGAVLWTCNYNGGSCNASGPPAPTTDQVGVDEHGGCGNTANTGGVEGPGRVGILGTPVINPASDTIYFVTHTMEGCSSGCGPSNEQYRLRAVNMATGVDRANSPSPVFTAPGFNAAYEKQLPGLALDLTDNVYVAFGSFCDHNLPNGPYHGYVFKFDGTTLALRSSPFNSTPSSNEGRGAIWQSGQAPAVDFQLSTVYVATGNGDYHVQNGKYSDCVLGLMGNLAPGTNYYIPVWPDDQATLDGQDLDVSASGPTLGFVPGVGELLFQGSKTGTIYNLQTTLGSTLYEVQPPFQAADSHLSGGDLEIHSVVYASTGVASGPALYVAANGDYVRGFHLDPSTGKFNTAPFATSNTSSNQPPRQGANMSFSANGLTAKTGILWLTNLSSNNQAPKRVLYALNADNLQTLWTSDTYASDTLGTGVYWNPPIVVNGSVYAASILSPLQGSVIATYGPRFLYAVLAHGHFYPFRNPVYAAASMSSMNMGANGAMYVRSRVNGGWPAPTAVTSTNFAPATSMVVTAAQTTTQEAAFIIPNTGSLDVLTTTNGTTWGPPTALTTTGFAPAGAPLATASQGGQLGVAMVDTNGKLEIMSWTAAFGWQGPLAVTAANYAPPGAFVTIGTRSTGELDVFSVGSDGALKYMWYLGGVWGGPYVLTATNFAPPGAPVATATDVHGYLNILTIGNDGALYTDWDVTPAWSGATALTATGFAPPGGHVSAINFKSLSMNVFLVDNAGTIDALSNVGVGWVGPTAVGANLAQPGAAVGASIEGTNQLDLFAAAVATASGLVESTNTGSGWSAPVALP